MDILTEVKSKIDRAISDLETCRLLAQRLPEYIGICDRITLGFNELIVALPNSREAKEKAFFEMAEFGWRKVEESIYQPSGALWVYFAHPECAGKFLIIFDATLPGASCKRQIVGYKQEPIYEVTCLEAEPLGG